MTCPPESRVPVIVTDRLELCPMSTTAITALRHGDRSTLEAVTSACFGTPLTPPPLLSDALPEMASRLCEHPEELGYWCWLVIRRDDRRALGSIGFGGLPDADGRLAMGYSVYEEAHSRGYATEAARGLMHWAFHQPGVHRICATIPAWNVSSRRVAEKIGMTHAGLIWEEELGEDVELWSVQGP